MRKMVLLIVLSLLLEMNIIYILKTNDKIIHLVFMLMIAKKRDHTHPKSSN